MYEDLEKIEIPHASAVFGPWDREDIKEVRYSMTPLGSNPLAPENVKLGAKLFLHTGEQYGNIIEVPLKTLKELIQKAEK